MPTKKDTCPVCSQDVWHHEGYGDSTHHMTGREYEKLDQVVKERDIWHERVATNQTVAEQFREENERLKSEVESYRVLVSSSNETIHALRAALRDVETLMSGAPSCAPMTDDLILKHVRDVLSR